MFALYFCFTDEYNDQTVLSSFRLPFNLFFSYDSYIKNKQSIFMCILSVLL